jgi:hypothetical protein
MKADALAQEHHKIIEIFPFGQSIFGSDETLALESADTVISAALLKGVLTVPGAVIPGAAI